VVVEVTVEDGAIRVASTPPRGSTALPFGYAELVFEPPLFCELAEMIARWDSVRQRWSMCTTTAGTLSRFAPGRLVADRRSVTDPDCASWVQRARALELVSCYDEFFGDLEVAGVLVSGFDETAGVWVRGPAELGCLLTRRTVFIGHALDEAACLLAARCLAGGQNELDRPRLSRLSGVLLGASAAPEFKRVSEEFSSLRAVNFQL